MRLTPPTLPPIIIDRLRADDRYESRPGDHTLTQCPCDRQSCRGTRCRLCIAEEIARIETRMEKA